MKKIIAALLVAVLAFSLYACGKEDGLGKQTTIDRENGYTMVQGVLTFKYKEVSKALKEDPNAKTDGFVVSEDKAMGDVSTKSAALEVAKQEVTDEYNKVSFAYDRTRGIWRVTFAFDTEKGEEIESKTVMTVYVDEDGYTVATVKGE